MRQLDQLVVSVPGIPIAQGSMTAIRTKQNRTIVKHASKGLPAWRNSIIDEIEQTVARWKLRDFEWVSEDRPYRLDVAFWFPQHDQVIAGDVLFAGSIGRTDLPGGSYQQLMATIREVIVPLGDGVEVVPGHGPSTTVGEERRTNPFLLSG